jgi:hypothetical protein
VVVELAAAELARAGVGVRRAEEEPGKAYVRVFRDGLRQQVVQFFQTLARCRHAHRQPPHRAGTEPRGRARRDALLRATVEVAAERGTAG